MRVIAQSLSEIERAEPASEEQLAAAVERADRFRRRHGIPVLADSAELPEEGFYRRARALGFRRIRR